MLFVQGTTALFAQQPALRLATTATVQPRWTALASHNVYLLATTATQARGQNVMGIFAATNKGLFQSLDTGQTWGSLGLPNDDVYDAVFLGSAVIAATDKGIQSRASASAAWQSRTYPVVNQNSTQATVQQRGLPTYTLHTLGTNLYAGTTRGVYRSQDGGATWTTTGTALAGKTVRNLVALGGTLFAAVWNDGVYWSQDNGATWTLVDIVPGSTVEKTFRTLAVYGTTIYAGSAEGNVYQSANGITWTKVVSAGNNGQSGINARGVEALASYGTTIVGAAYNGIAVSHNNGQTWALMPVATQNINTIVILPPKPPAKRSSTTTLAAGKQGASLTLVACDGGNGQNYCGGGGVAVGSGGTGGSGAGTGGVSGFSFVGCNPFAPNFTLTPSTAVQQNSPFNITFSVGVSAVLTDFRIEIAAPNNPNSWFDFTTSYSQAAGNTITGTAIIDAGFMQNPGTYRLRVWGIREDGVCTGGYTSESRSFDITPAAPILSMVTVAPAGAYAGQASSLTLTGSNFAAQPNVSIAFFNASAQPMSIPTTPTSFSPTAITVNATIPQPGLYYAEVRNTVNGTTYSSGRVSFTIAVPPAPVLSSVTLPNSALRLVAGATGSITLGGSNFSTSALDGSAGGATVSVNGQNGAWTIASRTASALTVTIPASLAAGTYTLRVVNADGQVSSASQDVLVVPPLAVAASTPETLIVEEASTVTMTGTFRSAATLVDAPNRTGATATSNTAISFGVTIPGANAPTSYSITLSEPTTFGQTALTRTIPVRFPLPALTSITPNELSASTPENGASTTITLAGTGFTTRTSVFAGTRDLSAFITARSQTALTLTFPSGTFPTPEVLQIRAENPGAQVSGTQTLTVKNIAPVFTSVAPQTLVAGEGGNITITGSKFFNASVTQVFVGDDANAVQLAGATVTPTSITVSVPAARVPDIGTLRLTVRNVFGTDTQQADAQTVRIIHAQPTISAIAPALIPAFENSTTLTITGTKFAVGQSTAPIVPARLRVTWVRNNVETALTLLPNPTATELRVSIPAALLTELGTAAVRVQNTDAAESNGGPSANSTVTVVPPRPLLSSVAPATVLAGNVPVMLTVSGAKFIASGIRIILRNTQTGVSRNLTATTFLSNTSVSGFIPSDMQPIAGNYTLEVVNAPDAQGLGGGTSTTTLPLTILNPPPSITNLTPTPNPATVFSPFTLEINGSGFIAGATAVEVDGQAFPPASVTILSPTRLTVSVAAIAVAKNASVRVTNPKTMVGTAEQGGGTATTTLPVVPPVPTVTLAQGNQAGGTLTRNLAGTLTITGSGFVAGATVLLNGQALTTTLVSQTALTAAVPASMLPTHGAIGVAVRNPQFASLGGGTSTPEMSVTVQNPTAVLNGISPNAVTRGFAANITFAGNNFYDGAVVTLASPSGAVVATFATTFVSSNALSITIPSASLPLAGAYTLAVRNSDPTPAFSTARTFTVNNPAAVLGSLSLTEAEAYSTDITLTASGSGFEQGLQAYWTPQGGSRETLPAPTGVSANACTITIPAALLLRAGAFSISLENAAPSLGVSNNLSFTVLDRVPTVSAATPNPIEALSGNTQITITGDFFAPTAEALWDGQVLTRVGTASRTSLVATVTASRLLVATIAAITVRNPQFNGRGGGISTSAHDLTVTNPLPALTNLTPDFVNAGVSRATVTLDGTKFMAVSVVEISDGTVWQAVTTAYVSPTRLSILLSSAALVQPRVLRLRVSSPKINNQGGGTSAELPFIIRPADPTLTRLSPTSATLTATSPSVEITLIGTGFTPASVVRLAGIPTTGTLYLSPTQLRITLARPAGVYALSVANDPILLDGAPQGGGVSGNLSFAFLHPQPILSALLPSTTAANITAWTLRLTGANFLPQSRVSYNGALIATTNVVCVSPTELRAIVPEPPIAATTIPVRVENPLVAGQGGGFSATLPLEVQIPKPIITSLSDYTTAASLVAWTISINGQLFATNATLTLNGQPIAPTSITDTRIRVELPGALMRNVGYYTLAVTNPATVGGGTAEATFTVNNPAPTLVSITPTTTTASNLGSLTFTLTGTQFTTTSSIVLDGPTMNPVSYSMSTGVVFVSPTVLRLTIPQSRITTSGNYTLRVVNPLPGGGQSVTRVFAVTPALPSRSEFVGVPTEIFAGTVDAFSVHFQDQFGNAVAFPATTVNFTNETGSSTGSIALTATTNPTIFRAPATFYTLDGTYRFWISGIATTTGNASFVVNANNDARVEFSNLPTKSIIVGTEIPKFTAKYYDRFNNLTDRGIGDVIFRTSPTGNVIYTIPMERLNEGIYRSKSFSYTTSGTYFLRVRGITLPNTGYSVEAPPQIFGGQSPPVSLEGSTSAIRSHFEEVDVNILAGRNQTDFIVKFYDIYDNLIDYSGLLSFSNSTSASMDGFRSSSGTISLTRLRLGVYRATTTQFTTTGNYTFAVEGVQTTTGTNKFSVSPLSATHLEFSDVARSILVTQNLPQFAVRFYDRYGNITDEGIPTAISYRNILGFGPAQAIPITRMSFGNYISQPTPIEFFATYRLFVNGFTGAALFEVLEPIINTQPPSLTFTGSAINGNNICLGSSEIRMVEIEYANFGSSRLSIGMAPDFQVSLTNATSSFSNALTMTLASTSGTIRLFVKFTPSVVGQKNSIIFISTDGGKSISMIVRGSTIAPVFTALPSTIMFPPTPFSEQGRRSQSYTLTFPCQNATSVTITAPTGFFVRSTLAGCTTYSPTCTIDKTPAVVEVILNPNAAGNYSGEIINSCGILEQRVAVSGTVFQKCDYKLVDTISVLVLYTPGLPGYLAATSDLTFPKTVRDYLETMNNLSPIIFRNSRVNNVAIAIANPEGDPFTFEEVGVANNEFFNLPESGIADRVRITGSNPGSRIAQLRDRYRADVVCVMGWGFISEALGSSRDTLRGINKNDSYIFLGAAGPPDSYVFQHEIGHLCLGNHEPGACTGYGSPYPDGQGFFDGNYACIGDGSFGNGVGTIMFHGYRENMTRIPYWSNPNISYTDTRRNRTFALGTTQSQNMSRVMSVSAQHVANFYPNASNVEILGRDALRSGSRETYIANPCSGGPYTFEWYVTRTRGNTQGPFSGNSYSLTMPIGVAGITLRLVTRDARGETFEQEFFVEAIDFGRTLPIPVVALNNKLSSSLNSSEQSSFFHTFDSQPVSDKKMFSSMTLEQNQPNPFNTDTEIAYTLDRDDNVTLTLHDALGRVVLLIDQAFRRAGRYSFVVQAADLPSGVYRYRLRVGGDVQMKTCIIMK